MRVYIVLAGCGEQKPGRRTAVPPAGHWEIALDSGLAKTFIELTTPEDSVTTTLPIDRFSDVRFAAVRFFVKGECLPSDGFAGHFMLTVNGHRIPVPREVLTLKAGWVRFPVNVRMLREGENEVRITNETGSGNTAHIGVDEQGTPLIRLVLAEGEDTGLVGRWDFERTLADSSGYGHHGVKEITRYEKAHVGYGHFFEGKDGVYVRVYKFGGVPEELVLHRGFSFEAWIKPEKYSNKQTYLLDLTRSGTSQDVSRWRVYLKLNEHGTPVLVYWNEAGSTVVSKKNSFVPPGEWSHVGVVFDRGYGYIILNGYIIAGPEDERVGQPISNLMTKIYIGGEVTGEQGFNGIMDEVCLRNNTYTMMVPLDVHLRLPDENAVEVSAYAFGMWPDEEPHVLTYELERAETRHIVESGELAQFEGRRAFASIAIGGFDAGKYRVSFQALDRKGNILGEDIETFTLYDTAGWEAELDYDPEEVLYPWTPVEVAGNRISVWGREYDFTGSLFLAQINTRNADIFHAPISLTGSINSQPFTLSKGTVHVDSASSARVVLNASGSTKDLKIETHTAVEFDGMIRVDITITPLSSVRCDSLKLVIPIKRENGGYFNYWPSVKYPELNFGAVPNTFTTQFINHIWIGDTKRGLAWFAESHRGWLINSKKIVLTINSTGDVTDLIISIVNEPTDVTEPMHVTFGLQATPVKQMPLEHRDWNISRLEGEIHQDWPNIYNYQWFSLPNPADSVKYARHIEEAHGRGIRWFIPYAFFSDIDTPLMQKYQQYMDDWDADSFEWDISHMRQYSRFMCPRNPEFRTFWCLQLKRFLERFDADGFYFDGSWPLVQCYNPRHGHTNCYYYDKYGAKHYECQIFAYREMMRKIYAFNKKDNLSNIIVNHCSAALVIPILSFGDALLDGEHFGQYWFDGDYIRFLTDDVRIAEFCGDQLGIECLWLPQYHRVPNANTPENARTLMGLLLLHDTRLWVAWIHASTVTDILKAVKEFDIIGTEFVAFFHENPVAMPVSKNVRVSAYQRGNELLLVVMNLSEKAKKSERVTINRKNAGFLPGGSLSAVDQESNSSIPIDGKDVCVLKIPAKDFRLIRITQ